MTPLVRSVRLAAIALALAAVATPALAQRKPVKKGLVWDGDRPSIVFGRDVNIDLRMKLQLDWRWFDPDVGEKTFDVKSMRVGLKGEATRHFDYEIERELNEDLEFKDWKDVYVDWHTFDAFGVEAGRFKMPFGLEQLTGPTETDFAYRSLASSTIAPARDRGVMAHGRFWGRDLTYEAGVFNTDGDNGKLEEPQFVPEGEPVPDVGPTFAARITGTPLRALGWGGRLRSLRLGGAYTNGELPEGLNSLRGESLYGTYTFFEPVYVKGRRQRFGTELEWTPGSFGLKAEWMQAREDRLGQGNRNEDLSDFVSTGWYVSGTWLVTGENKDSRINPRHPLFTGGAGALELGVRYDQLWMGSAGQDGQAYSNPRADPLVSNSDKVWTFGANWFPNRWVRAIVNVIHEAYEDPSRVPVKGTGGYWSALVRAQLVF